MRILLAAAQTTWAELVVQALAPHNASVKVVSDGPIALHALQTGNYDVVLIDASLPSIDPLRLCADMRALDESVFLAVRSPADDRETVELTLAAGANDLIPYGDSKEQLEVWFLKLAKGNARQVRSTDRAVSDAELVIDRGGNIVSTGSGAAALTGFSNEEMRGNALGSFVFSPGSHNTIAETLWAGSDCEDCRYRTKGGPARYCRVEVLTGNVGFEQTIRLRLVANADRALANEAVRLGMAREQSLADAVRDGILVLDRSGGVVYANKTSLRLFGMVSDYIVARPVDELLVSHEPAHTAPVSRLLDEAFRSGSLEIRRAGGLRHDGGKFNCELTISEIHPGPDSSRWVVVIRPTAQRELQESRARESARMEAMAVFAGRLANDFNNTLAAIGGSVEAALLCKDENDLRVELDAAIQANTRAARLVRRLTSFANPAPSRKKTLDPGDLIETAVDTLRRELDPKITIKMDLGHGDWRCDADNHQIVDTLINLGYNARDAMPAGGFLSIQTGKATQENGPADDATSQFIRIDVADTGSGVDREILPRIFEPMFTTKGTGSGAGLGLARVYDILKQHGGGITVESTVNSGTQFHIFLPRSFKATETTVETKPCAESQRGGTILIVDDEDTVRRPCVRALEHRGYNVLQASDGIEGIRIIDSNVAGIDAVVLDIVMPNIGGWEVLAHIKTTRPDLPVLMVSGYSGNTSDPAAQLYQPDGFLQKPFELKELVAHIGRMLESMVRPGT